MSLLAVMTAKEAVNRAFETTLAEGIRFERRTFQALFATHDQKEGMAAFVEKRPREVREQIRLTLRTLPARRSPAPPSLRGFGAGRRRRGRHVLRLEQLADRLDRRSAAVDRRPRPAEFSAAMPGELPCASSAAAPSKPSAGAGSSANVSDDARLRGA